MIQYIKFQQQQQNNNESPLIAVIQSKKGSCVNWLNDIVFFV